MRFPWICLLAGLMLGAGCATGPDQQAFDVSLTNLAPGGQTTLWETTVGATVRLQNASPEPMVLTGAAHKIYLNGRYVGQGLSSERIEVPRLGTVSQQVTVHLKNFALLRELIGLQQNPTAAYRVESTLYASGGTFGSRSFRAQKEGSVNLSNLVTPTSNPGFTPLSSGSNPIRP